MHKEIMSRLNMGHDCYHLIQNLLSFDLHSINIQIKIQFNSVIMTLVYATPCL